MPSEKRLKMQEVQFGLPRPRLSMRNSVTRYKGHNRVQKMMEDLYEEFDSKAWNVTKTQKQQ